MTLGLIWIKELCFLLLASHCVEVDFKVVVMLSWQNVILEAHNFFYYFVVLKEIMWYVILLILNNEFRMCKVSANGGNGDVDGMISVDGRDENVNGMIIGNELIAEATKKTYFNAGKSFLRNYGSAGKIILLIARKFVVDALVFLICQKIYRFSNFLF